MTQKKSNVMQINANRKKYSAQFKEQVLERVKKDGVPRVSEDLGIADSIIYNWRKQSEKTGIPFEEQKIQAAELARLKREVVRLAEENAFLKKVAAYFTKEGK